MPSSNRMIENNITNASTTVSNTATAIPASNRGHRKTLLVQNVGTNVIYLGDSSVTTANGYKFEVGDVIEFQMTDNVTLYGITASGTSDIRTIEGV